MIYPITFNRTDFGRGNACAKFRVAMRSEVKELHQRMKTTWIYVTHDQIEAMTMGDQIMVMRGSLIEQAGRPLELYDHPADTFAAGFVGSAAMNLLAGKVIRRETSVHVERSAPAARYACVPTPRDRTCSTPRRVRPCLPSGPAGGSLAGC